MTHTILPLLLALVAALVWCFRLWRELNETKAERDEWIEKAQRYYDGGRAELGMQMGLLSGHGLTPEETRRLAEFQRQMMGTCAHGDLYGACWICRRQGSQSSQGSQS